VPEAVHPAGQAYGVVSFTGFALEERPALPFTSAMTSPANARGPTNFARRSEVGRSGRKGCGTAAPVSDYAIALLPLW